MQRKDPFVVGEYYHIYNRGTDKRIIFRSHSDYKRFIMLLYVANNSEPIRLDDEINGNKKSYLDIFQIKKNDPLVSISSWCLMPNHFHLLLKEEVEGGISKFMKKLCTGYSMYFNIKYDRTGGLFGGPFKSKCVKDDFYLQHLFGYVNINPLELKFTNWEKSINKNNFKEWQSFLEKYQFSSFLDLSGVSRIENRILNLDTCPKYFSRENTFKDFVEDYLLFNP